MVLNKSTKDDKDSISRMIDDETDQDEAQQKGESQITEDSQDGTNLKSVGQEYLFIEEVIFLYEQGKLEIDWEETEDASHHHHYHENSTTASSSSYRLYSLLEPCGVSLAAYLVYAHLRSQNFRVLRHTSTRRKILETMKEVREFRQESLRDSRSKGGEQDAKQNFNAKESERISGSVDGVEGNSNESNTKPTPINQMNQLIYALREDAAKALPPTVYHGNNTSETKGLSTILSTSTIAFDVYKPNTHFSRRVPGLPDFYVAATFYSATRSESSPSPSLTFDQLQDLLRSSDGVPLRIATVSDSGTVIMFGVTDFGVPEIQST